MLLRVFSLGMDRGGEMGPATRPLSVQTDLDRHLVTVRRGNMSWKYHWSAYPQTLSSPVFLSHTDLASVVSSEQV